MTHLTRGDGGTAVPATLFSSAPQVLQATHTLHRRLDCAGLRGGIARRRLALADLEAGLVTACERAAARGASRAVRIDDRATWDRATWQRYLDAATRLEPDYGPSMRRLLREIDQLMRLIDLMVGA